MKRRRIRTVRVAVALQEIASRIKEREARYGVVTADMRNKVGRGELEETAEICEWLEDFQTADYLERRRRPL